MVTLMLVTDVGDEMCWMVWGANVHSEHVSGMVASSVED